MVRSFLALCAALSVCLASLASAQTTTSPTVYAAVDAVSVNSIAVTITGIVQGEQAVTTRTFYVTSSSTTNGGALIENCERLALMAMAKPGQYLFEILAYSYSGTCKLSRVTP